jgi:hypothetical protein
MPNYSDQEVVKRVGDKKDAGRAGATDKLFAQATQPPHDDDASALAKLQQLAGDDSTGGWATNDARNYTRMKLNSLPGAQPMEYSEARDGRFSVGKALGGLMRVAAPIAGMAIPGLGPLGALAVGGLGNSAGQLVSGGKFNPLEAVAAGAAPAVGRHLMGAGGAPDVAGGVGNATQSMPAAAASLAQPASGGIAGAIGKLGGLGTIGKVGIGAAKFLGDRAQRKSAEEFGNAQLALRQKQLGMAEQDYAARAPMRSSAFERLGQMAKGPMGSSVYR